MDNPQTVVNLYITLVEKEGPFLKIWGQMDKNNSVYVEQLLAANSEKFDLGNGRVPTDQIQINTLICAKYKDSKYYRARITDTSFVNDGFVEVCFLDYGNRDVVSVDNIRSLQNFPTSFISVQPLARGFIFAEAHCVGGGEWNENIFGSIVKEIKYREVHCQLLFPATQYFLIKIFIDGTDLCPILIQRGLLQSISLQAQQAVLLSMSMQRQTQHPNAPVAMSTSGNNIASGGLNTYKASSLEPGCLYPVYVSYVNDGPCHFSVQLKNSEEVLVKLMNEINSINLRLLEDVPMPGTICLAKCQEDGNICRAVVTNEVDNQFKVFYVDFGNYETVPLESLFQIPFKYVLPKVMAIRLSLGGVEKPTVTLDMQKAFKQFVDNRLLHMKVIPSSKRMAIPKCELWDPETKTSALDVVNRAARHSYPEPISLTRGFSQLAKVSYVYSCNRFYVQLSSKENELIKLMDDLQDICQSNEVMDPSNLKPGLPCCALFETDGKWYRSEVVEVHGHTVVVRYIDFGNEEEVSNALLKDIDGEQLTVLRPQALECCLNGYQNMVDDQERDLILEELILEKEFTMKVVDMFNKKALIELYDVNNCNVASLLLDRLAVAKSQVSPALVVQAGNKIELKKSYGPQGGMIRGGDEQYFRFDRKERGDKQGGRVERADRQGREKRDFKQQNENWRQDTNRDFRHFGKNNNRRKYDRNSNENGQDSWRHNNKGFSPRQNKFNKSPESDAWNSKNTSPNNNHTRRSITTESPQDELSIRNSATGGETWNDSGAPTSGASSHSSDWNTNDKGGRGNQHVGRFNNDRNTRGDRGKDRGERFGGKPRDKEGGGYRNKFDTRSENFYDEKGYQQKGGGSRTSSRNEYRNNKFHKPYQKPPHSNNSSEDSWDHGAGTPTTDAAMVTATYGSRKVVGTEANVAISWFHNPAHFFLQLQESQEEFKRLMEDIQQFYKSRQPDIVSAVGAPVVGLFPEDNVLYRAQILDIVGTNYKIYYVDFGNVSTVSKVWRIEKKFMNLPAQAIVCSLRDVAPPGETGTWPDADSYSSYFDKDSFVCKFVDEDEHKTYVNLYHNSEEIAELLVRDGKAVSTKSSVPPVEIPLLLEQQFKAIVKSVNNLADIILALECGLVVCCAMNNLETATETHEDTLKAMLEQAVIVYVDKIIDDKLVITLYDMEGNKITIVEPDEGAFDNVEPLCQTLVLRSTISGYVPFAEQTFVYIQFSEYTEQVTLLLEQLFEFYDAKEKEKSHIIPEEEQIYAVKSKDGNWYRGKVISFDDETVTVMYVDYGNTESVKFEALSELVSQFKTPCALCLKVNIGADATPYVDKEVTAKIFNGGEGWEGTVFVSEEQIAASSMIQIVQDADISNDYENVETLPTVVSDEDTKVAEVSQEGTTVTSDNSQYRKGTSVIVSHIDSPNEFYLQLMDSDSDIEQLQLSLQEKIPQMPVLETPSPGMLCAAPYSADQEWYRAEILDADDDITTVRFVDFGNTDVIDNKTTEIKTLPTELLSLAVYATKCSLIVKPREEEWSPASVELFETSTMENVTADFLHQDGKLNYVELYDQGRKLSDLLIEQGFGKATETQGEETSGGKMFGFVSHLNSPSEFWIQLENCIDMLESIAESLSTAENFPELEDLTPGTLCAARFPDDLMWYRARILSNTVAGIELLFIDYGNSCTGNSLRQLPEELVMIQPLAMKCSLRKPDYITSWSDEASATFEELSADGGTIFTIKKLSTGETSVVELFIDDEDIVPELLGEYSTTESSGDEDEEVDVQEHMAKPTEKKTKSAEEGYVTQVESLDNFDVQLSMEKLKNCKLENVEGKLWEKSDTEKFEKINKGGTTMYQIEFIDDKTVRLSLDGKDIKLLLGPDGNSTENPDEDKSETHTKQSQEAINEGESQCKITPEEVNEEETPAEKSIEIKRVAEKHEMASSTPTESQKNTQNIEPVSSPEAEVADKKTVERENVSPLLSPKDSAQGSQKNSRPSSRNCSQDEQILPADLSRPESPMKVDDSKVSAITEISEKAIDNVNENNRNKPQSGLSHKEEIVP